jgi:hypothetical protein
MNPPSPRNDEEEEDNPPSARAPPTLTQLLFNENALLNENGVDPTTSEDIRDLLHKFTKAVPFVLLLLARFLLAYIAKFFSLIFINIYQYRINSMFDEQVSLKSFANRNAIWTLCIASMSLLGVIYLAAPLLVGVDVIDRLLLASFHPESHDFISILWLCYFSDTTLRLLLCTVKIFLYFLFTPRNSSTDSSGSVSLSSFACIFGDCMPSFSSLTTRG